MLIIYIDILFVVVLGINLVFYYAAIIFWYLGFSVFGK